MIDEKKLIEKLKESGLIADNEYGNTLVEFIENQPKVREWIPCSERMPQNEECVEITYTRKNYKTGETLYFTSRAFHQDGTMLTKDSSYNWGEVTNMKYIEQEDSFIIPEGWWGYDPYLEDVTDVDERIIAWRPLPEPYKEDL